MSFLKKLLLVNTILFTSVGSLADGFAEGIPVAVQKSDYSNIHVTFVQLDRNISGTGCSSNNGLVILDSYENSKTAISFALAAQASGKKFRCYIVTNQCSVITGAADTYPVCAYYPAIVN